MLKLKTICFFLFPFTMVSQHITGKIYDAETTVKGAKVFNTCKNIVTYTNNYGEFNIKASINDTLIFYSLFHKQKNMILDKDHFKDIIVIHLKKKINDLDEVVIRNNPKEKTYNQITFSNDFGVQLKNDIKNNPHLYGTSSEYGLDFIRVISSVNKLFKKNKKTTSNKFINHKTLDSLFSKDSFFSKNLLIENLKITDEYSPLFFDFCEEQNINQNLLEKENQLLLLEQLIKYSNKFIVTLNNYNKHPTLD